LRVGEGKGKVGGVGRKGMGSEWSLQTCQLHSLHVQLKYGINYTMNKTTKFTHIWMCTARCKKCNDCNINQQNQQSSTCII